MIYVYNNRRASWKCESKGRSERYQWKNAKKLPVQALARRKRNSRDCEQERLLQAMRLYARKQTSNVTYQFLELSKQTSTHTKSPLRHW